MVKSGDEDLGVFQVILLGDSIFDNAVYVPGEPAVVEQLNAKLGDSGSADLLAVDGHMTQHVSGQAQNIPDDATHLFVSVGGNDALEAIPVLHHDGPAQSLLAALKEVQAKFIQNYSEMLDDIVSRNLPTTICTIYDAVPDMEAMTHASASSALSLFNDVIVREATSRGLPIIDLRLVCDTAEDYSHLSPIEPSAIGGEKITQAIHHVLIHHDFDHVGTKIYGKAR
ncbi:MAG: SGNH/GDSL hydrolase family protein [Arenicellales bacterium]|nr:SGNH/GDSL hydrolase family protein [Arenicellales bacterium]